jgi:hypothetical protein
MTVVVPEPVPLEMPPGDPAALEDFVADVAGTAYRLAVVSTCLTSSNATAPHWRGADASAAAAQIGVVASLAEELSGGVAAAAHRLRMHHDRLIQVRQRIAALRTQQDEDFAVAWGRLSRIEDYQLVAMTDGPQAVGIVEELEAAEAARRREHAGLLEELADDAAATARELADASRVVGGSGGLGDGGQVIAHLAAELPGWGDAELRRRGADLAGAVLGTLSPIARESAAREAAAYAGSTAFSGTFLAALGEDGVRDLLTLLGDGDLDATSALARTLGLALGSAVPTGPGGGAVGEVLTATYIDADDVGTHPDLVALGMGVVLRAGGTAGPRLGTVVNWGRQMLDRERVQGQGLTGSRAVDRAAPIGEVLDPTDPMEVVLERLTRDHDASYAAAFLAERSAWDVLLARPWDDDAIAFGRLIDHAGTAGGPVGGDAARAGLEALGTGLDDGDPDGWTVDRGTAAVVAEPLAGSVVAHIEPVAGALERAADGTVGPRDGDALRGLGYLTLDEGAARAVQEGLHGWATEPTADPGPAEVVVVVEGAFVAAREYGQRLAYALHGFEQQAAAELSKDRWDAVTTILTLPVAPSRRLGRVLGSDPLEGALDYAAMVVGWDGTWDNGVDEGVRFGRGGAVRAVLGLLPHEGGETEMLATRAVVAYDRTTESLGSPLPPTSPVRDYIGPLLGGLRGLPGGALGSFVPDAELIPDVADDVNQRIDDLLHD